MPRWELFLGATVIIVILVLALSRASESIIADAIAAERDTDTDTTDDERESVVEPERPVAPDTGGGPVDVDSPDASPHEASVTVTGELLLLNVAVSQALFAGIVIAILWYTNIPGVALGIGAGVVTIEEGVIIGILLGVVLYGGSELGGTLAEWIGLDRHERVRAVLAPADRRGWALLLGAVLPLIAIFEELLFRAVLIGAIAVGFDVSPWVLVMVSSILFATGHGAQGRAGIIVTGILGLVLGAVFVLTWSLLAVVVAHYVVNALEFIIHEGLDID